MSNKRSNTYLYFNKYKQKYDSRSMDDICNSSEGFQLQVQQKFLKEYIETNQEWTKLLLYHQIGSGKTCTAITLAEKYKELNPNDRITVILPARLKTNFIDEMISPCGMEKYISSRKFKALHDPDVSASEKAKIRAKVNKKINAEYEILSFEGFKKQASQTESLKLWVKQFTQNKLIIIDEVHNLLSGIYDQKDFDRINTTGVFRQGSRSPKGGLMILFKYLAKYAHPTCKMLLMTATPIFDNLLQLADLVEALDPEGGPVDVSKSTILSLIERLRGRVSFFPGTSPNAYPSVKEEKHFITINKIQDRILSKYAHDDFKEEEKEKDSFMAKQRQLSLVCVETKKMTPTIMDNVVSNLSEFAPKIKLAIKLIRKNKIGKHLVYSSFIEFGIKVMEEALKRKGWVNFLDVVEDAETWNAHHYKVYVVWDGRLKDNHKQLIKSKANNIDNMDGKYLRVILGSPSIKEGISFKHLQHLHMLDPVWNWSAIKQIEGRGVRFCSHVDIPKTHPQLKREVTIHRYILKPRDNGSLKTTSDERIYDVIIPSKLRRVQLGEEALKHVAIDHFLFRKLAKKENGSTSWLSTPQTLTNTISPLLLKFDEPLIPKLLLKKKINKCPYPRRPNPNCSSLYPFRRINKHGDECCYKKDIKGKKKTQFRKQTQNNKQTQNTKLTVRPTKVSLKAF